MQISRDSFSLIEDLFRLKARTKLVRILIINIQTSKESKCHTMSETNQTIFNNWKEHIIKKVQQIVVSTLQHQLYEPNKTKQFANQICEDIVKILSNTNNNFKYIANCCIVGAGGNGLDMAGICFWDNQMDGTVTYKFQGKYLTCIVNVYGCALA